MYGVQKDCFFKNSMIIRIYQSPILGAHSVDNDNELTFMNRKITCEDMINSYMAWSIEIIAQC